MTPRSVIFLLSAAGILVAAHAASAHRETVWVTMTNDGFSPSEITVDQEQTVRFQNTDTVPHWPASNFHPTHDLYPKFDPQAPVAPGASWTLRPRRAGSWAYHDHLNPQRHGTLTVTGEAPRTLRSFSFLESVMRSLKQLWGAPVTRQQLTAHPDEDPSDLVHRTMAACFRGGGRHDCYKDAAQRFFQRFGLQGTLALLAQNESVPEVYARCHEVTHYLSRQEFERVESIPLVYAQCDSTCHGGCYHGTLEASLARTTSGDAAADALADQFPRVCGSPTDYARPLVRNECFHGLGHAAMFVTDADLPRSLRLCDTLTTQDLRERCYSGVFMENSSSSTNLDHPSAYISATDPYFPCNRLDERYLKICYRYQSSHFALLSRHDWQKVSALCEGVPAAYRTECFRTVGTNQVGFTKDPSAWKANCELMPPSYQATCVAGVVSSLTYRFVGDVRRVETFCQLTRPEHQHSCIAQLGTALHDWDSSPTTHQTWCDELSSPTFRRWCNEQG